MSALQTILDRWKIQDADKSPVYLMDRSREDLAVLFAELGYKIGVEIGTRTGEYAQTLCSANPRLRLFCVDPYEAYADYRDVKSQRTIDSQMANASLRLRAFRCELIRKYSMDAVRQFKPESLDFCYIDGNHAFEYVVNDILAWSKIIKPGGIIAGHDYFRSKRKPFHVTYAVDAIVKAYKIKPLFILKKEWPPSWFWVKQ